MWEGSQITNLYELIGTIEKLIGVQNTSETSIKLGPTYPDEQKKKKIRKCFISIYPNREVLLTTVRDKFDILICYTLPELWNFNQITDELYPKIQLLLENRINLYLIPETWNDFKSGLVEIISEVFNLEAEGPLQVGPETSMENSIGRICQITTPASSLQDLLSLIKEKLNIPSIRYLGDVNSPIKKIFILVGRPLTLQLLKAIKRADIDTVICTNFTYNVEKIAEELDINLIDATHYIVNLGLLKLTQSLRMEHFDVEFLFNNLKPAFNIF